MSDKLESVVLKNFGPSVLKVKIPQNQECKKDEFKKFLGSKAI